MTLSNLTTRLNVKAVLIVSVFMLFFTIYNQWISFEERQAKYVSDMKKFTAYLETVIPAQLLLETYEDQGVVDKSREKQVLAINDKIQPIVDNVFIPEDIVKFGVYSNRLQGLVATGPKLDKSLLFSVEPRAFGNLFQTDTVTFGQQNDSVLWYGAEISYCVRPIKKNNEIIGYIFACINMDVVKAEMLLTFQKALFAGMMALLIAIMLFQEIFIRLKRELTLFAHATVEGRGRDFKSRIAELTPILRYISEQTDHMARLDRLNIIGEMAASIGHEVRNPMTTVRGYLQHLGNKPTFEGYKDHFELMINELDRANSIITEFLSLAKNKAMHFKESDLNNMIREVVPLLEADALRYNCQIDLDLQSIPMISLDKSSMRQLILNIVRNGIEAMPQGGRIRITTLSHESKVVLSFSDQGVGIPPEFIDKLGTPFFTTKETGVGIGLAICFRIVQRHNATIFVESEPERGTKFTIIFEPGVSNK